MQSPRKDTDGYGWQIQWLVQAGTGRAEVRSDSANWLEDGEDRCPRRPVPADEQAWSGLQVRRSDQAQETLGLGTALGVLLWHGEQVRLLPNLRV